MKKLLVILLSCTIALGASAQRGHFSGPRGFYAPQVGIGLGFYSPFYSPFYNPFYNPYYSPGYGARPTKLDRSIQEIKNDYSERIWAVKHDTTLKGKQRRQQVRLLKHEREKAINDAKLNYYRH